MRFIKSIFILTFILAKGIVFAQNETIILHTDKTTYLNNEYCWFSLYSIGNNHFSDISKIGYVEIIDQKNHIYIQEKISIQNGTANGALEIPDNIPSGDYYIRAYTLWSKNNQLAQSSVQSIHLFNTADKAIYQYKSAQVENGQAFQNSNELSFNGLQNNYPSNSKIQFSISNNNKSTEKIIGSISIYKIDSIQSATFSSNEEKSNAINNSLLTVPEFIGHRVAGTLTNKLTKEVLANERIYFSIPGNISQFKVTQTDNNGHFTFDIPNFIDQNIVIIQTENDQNKIQINFDPSSAGIISYFSPIRSNALPFNAFGTLLDHHIAKEIQAVYTYGKDAQFERINFDTSSFYNKPDVSYKLDDYVRFASLEETFVEFIPEISVESKKGHFSMYTYDFQSKSFFKNKPLVLVNGIPVFNMDKLFEYDPTRFKKIDIIARSYIYGNQVFNGIVNLITYDGQIEANSLIDNDFVFELKGIQKKMIFQNTASLLTSAYNERFPDYRTTLFWKPNLILTNDVKIETSSSALKGKYNVLFRGIDTKGQLKNISQIIQID